MPERNHNRDEHERLARWELRDRLRGHSSLKGMRRCGAAVVGEAGVQVRHKAAIGHYFTGVATCGSVWACPSCQRKVRQRRAVELDVAMRRWIADGGVCVFVTLTASHRPGERLRHVFDDVAAAFRGMLSGRWWKGFREDHDVAGFVRAREVTYGEAGWHPHIHAVLFVRRARVDRAERIGQELVSRWQAQVGKLGRRAVTAAQDVGVVDSVPAVAEYMCKVDPLSSSMPVALELARADLKTGKGLAPLQIAARAVQAFREAFDALGRRARFAGSEWGRLWLEFEKATKGRRAIEWSRGLRDELQLGEELTDEELAQEDVDGDLVLTLDRVQWRRLCAVPGATARLLDLLDARARERAPGGSPGPDEEAFWLTA